MCGTHCAAKSSCLVPDYRARRLKNKELENDRLLWRERRLADLMEVGT